MSTPSAATESSSAGPAPIDPAWLDRYARAFEVMTEASLADLPALLAPDVRFVDPFNDVRGADRYVAIFRHMYEVCGDPAFVVLDKAIGQRAAYLKWSFKGRMKGKPTTFEIIGMSEVTFDAEGRVTAHIDHWDAAGQLYERVPVLGAVLRMLRRRLQVD